MLDAGPAIQPPRMDRTPRAISKKLNTQASGNVKACLVVWALADSLEELIKKHSNEGDLIVDPFLGGGTTAIACKNTNRTFKGCEIDKNYYDKILKLFNQENTEL